MTVPALLNYLVGSRGMTADAVEAILRGEASGPGPAGGEEEPGAAAAESFEVTAANPKKWPKELGPAPAGQLRLTADPAGLTLVGTKVSR